MKLTGLTEVFTPFSGGTATDVDPEPAACGTDLMARGLAWLAATLPAVAGQPVVYQRGPAKVALCATAGRTLLQLDDGQGGVRTEWTDRDFLIPRASLVLAGTETRPRRGDVIKERKNGVLYTYAVLPYGNEPPWRWSDDYYNMLRVHAKLVDEAPA